MKALEKFRNETALNCIKDFNQKFNQSMLNFVYQILNVPLILTPQDIINSAFNESCLNFSVYTFDFDYSTSLTSPDIVMGDSNGEARISVYS